MVCKRLAIPDLYSPSTLALHPLSSMYTIAAAGVNCNCGRLFWFSASASAAVDMAVMSLGDHHVTSYGTYSFISVLLGRGHITHPIGHNTKYNLVDCVDSPFFHHISRDPTYEVDNSNVVLS